MKKKQEGFRKKNYYVDKIAATSNDLKKEFDEDQQIREIKQKKIRKAPKEVAKQARQRKKAYISLLESQMEELKRKNEDLMKKVAVLTNENQRLKTNKVMEENHFEGLIAQFQQLYKVLEKQNQGEISRSLSILRDKYGISGRQRFKAIKTEFDKILELSLPMHFRLLMENCQDNQKFYRLLSINNRIKQFVTLGTKEKDLLVKMRPQIIKHKERFDGILTDLYQIKERLFYMNRECQGTVDKIEDGLTPQFVGRLLIDLDFYRCEENLDTIYPINYWQNLEEKGISTSRLEMKIIEEEQVKPYNHSVYLSDLEILDELFG